MKICPTRAFCRGTLPGDRRVCQVHRDVGWDQPPRRRAPGGAASPDSAQEPQEGRRPEPKARFDPHPGSQFFLHIFLLRLQSQGVPKAVPPEGLLAFPFLRRPSRTLSGGDRSYAPGSSPLQRSCRSSVLCTAVLQNDGASELSVSAPG